MHLVLTRVAALSAVTILFAPSLKIRFDLDDTIVLYVPVLALALSAVMGNVVSPRGAVFRLRTALAFLLLIGSCLYAFFVGGLEQTELLKRMGINCAIGALIVVVPWDRAGLRSILFIVLAGGVALALSTLMFYRSTGDYSGNALELKEGYLNITFATGLGCLAAMYRVVERLSPVSIAAFAICWIGIAMSLGRGALLFAAVMSIAYMIAVARTRILSFGRLKKVALWVFAASLAPVVVGQIMKIDRSAGRFATLFGDSASSSGMGARFELYADALRQIGESPVVGNGLGAYLIDPLNLVGSPHNIVLQYGVDAGLVGLTCLGLFLALVIRALTTAHRSAGPRGVNLVYAMAALFGFMLLSYMKSHDAYLGREMFVLSALPLALRVATFRQRSPREEGAVGGPRRSIVVDGSARPAYGARRLP